MQLPEPTNDLEITKHQLIESGMCILPDVLRGDELKRARDAFYSAADEDLKSGNVVKGFGLDYDNTNQRVWHLLGRDPVFASLVEHPIALTLVKHLLGWPALLSNISGNLTQPGSGRGGLHADQIFVPQPWTEHPQGMIVAWPLDDMTEANGATEVAPDSHRLNRHPTANDEDIEMEPVIAQAGSVVVFESRIWHRTGANRSNDQTRALVLPFYTRPIYRTQENWFLSLDDQFIRSASDNLLTLLGYKSEGLGLVYGRSPR